LLAKDGESIAHAYQALVASGELIDDAAQRQAVLKLDRLREQLVRERTRRGWIKRIFGGEPKFKRRAGVYLTGKVGRGKTMLMDLFFERLDIRKKRRVHFHPFMQDVHRRLYDLRQREHGPDAVAQVATSLAGEAQILCLDEFQVHDIADAMLLGRLFEALIAKDVLIVASSNTKPEQLYEEGLNRQLFLPFIKLIKDRFEPIRVAGGVDYRLKRIAGEQVYVTPLGEKAQRHVQHLWEKLTDGERGRPRELKVQGRSMMVPLAAHGAARFTFEALCEKPLGAADYLTLARQFDTIFIEKVPVLGGLRRDARKRMIKLIDTLYDARVRVVISAEAPASLLAADIKEFERTASRLEEMQGKDYWSRSRSDV
jgi:cell division protein ZapE